MVKAKTPQQRDGAIHVAQDPRPAPASLHAAAARQAVRARQATAAIKAKRPLR